MRIRDIQLVRSPQSPDRVRLTARVEYRQGKVEGLFVEYPAECEPDISVNGTPWLAMLLPAAFWLGEPMELDAPVDPELYWNALRVQEIWHVWHSRKPVQISAKLLPPVLREGTRMAVFLTGGVDSLFTVLHCDQLEDSRYKPQDMLCVAGMDIPVWRDDQHQVRTKRLQRFCQTMNKRLLPIGSNIRNGLATQADYARLAHGAMLAGIGLGLGAAYSHLLLSSSYLCRQPSLHVWGSHPVTDPMFSTSGTRLIHYGAGFRRTEKTRFIAQYPQAMEALHVCLADAAATNCGHCIKCVRTLACLDMIGALDSASTFPLGKYHVGLLCGVVVRGPSATYFMNELLEMAREYKRRDIELAIRYAFARQSLFATPDILHRFGRSICKRLGFYRRPKHDNPWQSMPDEAKVEIQN